jgi:phenylpyruvate tautomerase PptA (4-oxalocrotonate tautomerase family)
MPNILIKVPQGSFSREQRVLLCEEVTKVASEVEQVGDDPRQQSLCWVLIDEVGLWLLDMWFSGYQRSRHPLYRAGQGPRGCAECGHAK